MESAYIKKGSSGIQTDKKMISAPSIHTPSSEKDRCVLCWGETEYSKDTPIEDRQFYIEGAGQLCEECYRKYRYCSE